MIEEENKREKEPSEQGRQVIIELARRASEPILVSTSYRKVMPL